MVGGKRLACATHVAGLAVVTARLEHRSHLKTQFQSNIRRAVALWLCLIDGGR